jgi:ATP-dependent Clp protease ATP-binding subunit ClpC
LRDREKNLINQLDEAKAAWEKETGDNRFTVTEENVAEVIAMMTGIPVKRIGQSEGKKLLTMEADLKKRVIGQDKALKNFLERFKEPERG